MNDLSAQQVPKTSGSGMTSARARRRLMYEVITMGISNTEVLEVMNELPRHVFVDSAIEHRAYENIALPLGWQQTISQPYTVARITELVLEQLARLGGRRERVLEIGAGCGYQAAILAKLFAKVYAVERIAPLQQKAAKHLQSLGLTNVRVAYQDGTLGWQQQAPFDAIVLSAATATVPPLLLEQLAADGCLVAPLGDKQQQQLTVISAREGRFERDYYDLVTFVPLLEGLHLADEASSPPS